MLKGEYQYALDDKGRVVIPPKFRHVLGEQVVATRSLDECVSIYSPGEWAKLEQTLQNLPTNKRDILRYMLAGAVDLEVDRQGRVTLPPHLRQHAKIDRDVVVVGLVKRLEVWNRSTWTAYLEKTQTSARQLAEQIEDLSI